MSELLGVVLSGECIGYTVFRCTLQVWLLLHVFLAILTTNGGGNVNQLSRLCSYFVPKGILSHLGDKNNYV